MAISRSATNDHPSLCICQHDTKVSHFTPWRLLLLGIITQPTVCISDEVWAFAMFTALFLKQCLVGCVSSSQSYLDTYPRVDHFHEDVFFTFMHGTLLASNEPKTTLILTHKIALSPQGCQVIVEISSKCRVSEGEDCCGRRKCEPAFFTNTGAVCAYRRAVESSRIPDPA